MCPSRTRRCIQEILYFCSSASHFLSIPHNSNYLVRENVSHCGVTDLSLLLKHLDHLMIIFRCVALSFFLYRLLCVIWTHIMHQEEMTPFTSYILYLVCLFLISAFHIRSLFPVLAPPEILIWIIYIRVFDSFREQTFSVLRSKTGYEQDF